MEVMHLVIAALSKKLVSVLVVMGILSMSTKDIMPHKTTDLSNKDSYFHDAGPYMHEGVNNFINVEGWDGNTYLASIELRYHKNDSGSYTVMPPEFVMVQKSTGLTFTYPALNIKNDNGDKLKYLCYAVTDSIRPGTINLMFQTYIPASSQEDSRYEESNYFTFDSPAGNNWKAYVDSTYTQTSDTTALLKFRLVRL